MAIIDIYTHVMPKRFLERLADLVPGHAALTAFPRLTTLWDMDARLRLLDQFDGDSQVLSLANPPLELIATPERTPELARFGNDQMAQLCRQHPDRFPAFVASLPMNHVDASLTEMDGAVGDLGAPCGPTLTNLDGTPVDAP